MLLSCLFFQLHRLVFSLRHSKEERKDLDWEQEEKGRRARRDAEERMREKNDNDTGIKEVTELDEWNKHPHRKY